MPERNDSILVVEDDADIRTALALLLRSTGYAVSTAADGAQAMDQMREAGPPALILLDLMMPVMDGWQLRAAMLADETLRDVPVVVLSGVHDLEEVAEALKAVASVPKPVSFSKLRSVISQHLPAAG